MCTPASKILTCPAESQSSCRQEKRCSARAPRRLPSKNLQSWSEVQNTRRELGSTTIINHHLGDVNATCDPRLPVGAVPILRLALSYAHRGMVHTPVALWRLALDEQCFDSVTAEDFLQTSRYQVIPFIRCRLRHSFGCCGRLLLT